MNFWRRKSVAACLAIASLALQCRAADYQWSVPIPATDRDGKPADKRAFLWIPPDCRALRGVIVAQHNMLEEDVLEHPDFRQAMAKAGVAEIWITPGLDVPFTVDKTEPQIMTAIAQLAEQSGYVDLNYAPIIPLGHSARASFPWNFGAYNPDRTLAMVSIHGDAPQTPLAGYGRPNPSLGDRSIDGIPGLMTIGEYEWVDARWAAASTYRAGHPRAPIAVLAEPGEGHFAPCDDLVHFVAMFITKCIDARLPADAVLPFDHVPALRPIDPKKGWLVQHWTLRAPRTVPPGPYGSYSGDPMDAFWALDQEMAEAIQNYHADQVEKKPQLVGFVQDGKPVHFDTGVGMDQLKFLPDADGETFKLSTAFLDAVPTAPNGKNGPGQSNLVRWTALPAGSPLGHAAGGGAIEIRRVEGPVEKIDADTFRLSLYRGTLPRPTIVLVAVHPGDGDYKRAVQQAVIPISKNAQGRDQVIDFAPIADQVAGAGAVRLTATSSAGLPVRYYVREGPAEVVGDQLQLLPIPPRAKFPVKVTVIAWQWGRAAEPKVMTAELVERSFLINAAKTH
ncbi:MAG: hypothetical protein ACTHLN_00930 [Tepidisphaeraceae bacterium]